MVKTEELKNPPFMGQKKTKNHHVSFWKEPSRARERHFLSALELGRISNRARQKQWHSEATVDKTLAETYSRGLGGNWALKDANTWATLAVAAATAHPQLAEVVAAALCALWHLALGDESTALVIRSGGVRCASCVVRRSSCEPGLPGEGSPLAWEEQNADGALFREANGDTAAGCGQFACLYAVSFR